MRLQTLERAVEHIGAVGQEHAFRIKATDKSFHILSSTLYKDKIRAIIRELSCNAADAHIAVGNQQRPFQVHLPNRFEPYFSIRDFGPGLSRDDVHNLYQTYFESTKTESDDFTGALGLGSKSPFCYSDTFRVISRFNGQKSDYTAVKGRTGAPTLIDGPAVDTDEESGLEVIVAVVDAHDIDLFAQKAASVFRVFDPVPDITGAENFAVRKPTIHFEGNGFRLVTRHSQFDGDGPMAIMGHVAYPIDARQITRLSQRAETLLRVPLDIDVPMGFVDFQPSREELSYDPQTVENIRSTLEKIATEVPSRLQERFDACKSEAEARRLHMALFQRGQFHAFAGGYTFRDKKIASGHFEIDLSKYPKLWFAEHYTYAGSCRIRTFGHSRGNDTLSLAATAPLFLKDIPRGWGTGLKDIVRQAQAHVFVLEGPDDQLAAFLDAVDGMEARKLSELKLTAPPVKRVKVKARQLVSEAAKRGNFYRDDWEPCEVDEQQGGLYVKTKLGTYVGPDGARTDFRATYKKALAAGLFDPSTPLYLIADSVSGYTKKNPGWVEFHGWLRTRLVEKVAGAEIAQKAALERALARLEETSFEHRGRMAIRKVVKLLDDPSHAIAAFLAAVDNAEASKDRQLTEKDKACLALCEQFGIPIQATYNTNLAGLWKDLVERYPLLKMVLKLHSYTSMADTYYTNVADYIRMVDSQTIATSES